MLSSSPATEKSGREHRKGRLKPLNFKLLGASEALGTIFFGYTALPLLQLIPLSRLGGLLAIVEICHASLIGHLKAKKHLAVAGTIAVVVLYWAIWPMASAPTSCCIPH